MSLWAHLASTAFRFLFTPFLFVLALTLVLASIGKSLGVRRLYVRVLLKVFQFARMVTAEHHQRRDSNFLLGGDDETDSDAGDETRTDAVASDRQSGRSQNRSDSTLTQTEWAASPPASEAPAQSELQTMRNYLKKYGKESRHNVISRKDNLILSPEKPSTVVEEEPHTHHLAQRLLQGENVSAATIQREFDLEDVLDYTKTGIAAIIEDEVTQRFVAEELKSWNLLTRTSLSFEFVNIKLTVIWVLGFFVRYAILLPCRAIVLIFGILYLLLATAGVGLIPHPSLRRWLYEYVALTAFRILSRSFSAVVKFHNQQYRPRSDGICVANHTTPIDVVILQMDRSYALLFWLTVSMFMVGQLRESEFKTWLHDMVYKNCFQILSGSLSAVITYHNPENKPKGGICVANHTSPIDVLILACDNAYALIGQAHGGFIGLFQTILESASHHIWFERAEYKDRLIVVKRYVQRFRLWVAVPPALEPGECAFVCFLDILWVYRFWGVFQVGQCHGGFFGVVQRALSRATAHVWFERSQVKDRLVVAQRLKEHVEDPNKLPILIFPEGTCINNTSVMQFKKGSFEVGGIIYPVAIKYDAQFGDAFWNSSQNGMLSYLYMMMTSWAIVCDVWYLPPMKRGDGEDAVHFANRVKAEIARQGGLVDLMWDGNLKRMQVKTEWKALQQEEFSRRLKVE